MLFQGIFTILLFLSALWLIWKLIIEPRLPTPQIEEDHRIELREKLEKLESLKREYESVREEKDVIENIRALDEKITEIRLEIEKLEA